MWRTNRLDISRAFGNSVSGLVGTRSMIWPRSSTFTYWPKMERRLFWQISKVCSARRNSRSFAVTSSCSSGFRLATSRRASSPTMRSRIFMMAIWLFSRKAK